jgi:hypothetical protein
MTFGVLTLATRNDYRKAIGLALSLRVSNPDVPVAVACSREVRPLLAPHFDAVIDEDPSLRGFVHKVHLDRYTPFEDTFFFDSDVLVFRDLRPFLNEWQDQAYNVCGHYMRDGVTATGFDRKFVRDRIGKDELAVIDGAGHCYFRKPACLEFFDLARRVTANYPDYVGGTIRYFDEEAVSIAMTIMGVRPRKWDGFFSRHLSAVPGTLKLDATNGVCKLVDRANGRTVTPCMMHFAANEAPVTYARQLRRLYRKFDVSPEGLYSMALADLFETEVKWRAARAIKRFVGRSTPVRNAA